MSDVVIRVQNLSKLYQIGSHKSGSLKETLAHTFKSLTGNKKSQTTEDFWALQDINFEIRQGEAVGIIGKNGAGKSTLLKILSRITEPTTGRIEINGRVSSLLEVGTGFHPELSGRENIFLNGTILGMSRREIKAKFDEIIDFSGVEKFIDTPVKHYSSGMYVRLAFAVAAHLEPEILIIDEVLAVGDAEFQEKCLGKMSEVAGQGRTVIFVSHSMGTIVRLCPKAIFMKNGQIRTIGETTNVVEQYLESIQNEKSNNYQAEKSDMLQKEVFFEYTNLTNTKRQIVSQILSDDDIILELKIHINQWHKGLELGLSLMDKFKRRVFTIHKKLDELISQSDNSGVIRLKIPSGFLVPSNYSWIFALHLPGTKLIDVLEDVCKFVILDSGTEFANYEGVDYGCVFIQNYEFEKVQDNVS